jgi:UDP-2,3-diacylglucosamine pyrophosphatase LpxH
MTLPGVSRPGRQRLLSEFIRWVSHQNGEDRHVHLVLNGDIVDFPAEAPSAPFIANNAEAYNTFNRIVMRTREVWESLRTCVRAGAKLTLLLGNTDLELSLPSPRRALLELVGPGRVEFVYDDQALSLGSVLIEHGNRYDDWNYISHNELRRVRSALSRRESLPPASVIAEGLSVLHVRRLSRQLKLQYPFIDLIRPHTAEVLPLLALLEPEHVLMQLQATVRSVQDSRMERLSSQVLSAAPEPIGRLADVGIDEKTEEALGLATELVRWESPHEIHHHQSFVDAWRGADANYRKNLLGRLWLALQFLAKNRYCIDVRHETATYLEPACYAEKRGFEVVVFGHTHLLKRVLLPGGGLYLNTGTWTDQLRLPDVILEDNQEAAWEELAAIAENMCTDSWVGRRELVPSFAQIDLSSAGELIGADLCLFHGFDHIDTVSNGSLAKRHVVSSGATLELLKSACAMVTAGTQRGIGYLISPDCALTSEHVVRQVGECGRVNLYFPHSEVLATILESNPEHDFALLALDRPPSGVRPLPLAARCSQGDQWAAYAFRTMGVNDGVMLSGTVKNPIGQFLQQKETLVLFSSSIAIGQGELPGVFSGSPVLVDGAVIGHLTEIPPAGIDAQWYDVGYLSACPIRFVIPRLCYVKALFSDHPSDNVKLRVGDAASFVVNLWPLLTSSASLSEEATAQRSSISHVDLLVSCPGAQVRPTRRRLRFSAGPEAAVMFSIIPKREGILKLSVLVCSLGEPIQELSLNISAISTDATGLFPPGTSTTHP